MTNLATYQVFPNPAKEVLNIDLGNSDNASVMIVNAVGQVVYSQNELVKSHVQIDVQSIEKGIYYAKITIGQQTFNEKFIVE